jgi:hypothetical protein
MRKSTLIWRGWWEKRRQRLIATDRKREANVKKAVASNSALFESVERAGAGGKRVSFLSSCCRQQREVH